MCGWSWSREEFTCKENFTYIAFGQLSLTLGWIGVHELSCEGI